MFQNGDLERVRSPLHEIGYVDLSFCAADYLGRFPSCRMTAATRGFLLEARMMCFEDITIHGIKFECVFTYDLPEGGEVGNVALSSAKIGGKDATEFADMAKIGDVSLTDLLCEQAEANYRKRLAEKIEEAQDLASTLIGGQG